MIVVAERNSQISRTFAQLRQRLTQPFVICRRSRTILGTGVRHLQIQPSGIAQEFCMRGMFGDFLAQRRRITAKITARQRHQLQLVLLQQLKDRRGAAELFDTVRTQLDSAKTQRPDILNRLAIVSAPGNRRVSEVNLRRSRRNRCIEVPQVRWRIKKLARVYRLQRQRQSNRRSAHPAEKLTTQNSALHHFFSSRASSRTVSSNALLTTNHTPPGEHDAIPKRYRRWIPGS